jgi:hypothetical protein
MAGDPAIAGWVSLHAPALQQGHLAAIAGALLVFAAGAWRRRRGRAAR